MPGLDASGFAPQPSAADRPLWNVEDWEAAGLIPREALRLMAADPELATALDESWLQRSLGTVLSLLTLAEAAELARECGIDADDVTLPVPWGEPLAKLTRVELSGTRLRLDGELPAVVHARGMRHVLVSLGAHDVVPVPLTAAGLSMSPARDMGMCAAGLCRVELREVVVDRARCVAIDPALHARLRWRRRLHASRALLGFCRQLLTDTFRFVGSRAFRGSVLSAMQVVRHRCADLDAVYRALRAQLALAERTTPSRPLQLLLLQLQLHDSVGPLVKACQQLLGGRGFLNQQWVTRAFRDSRGLSRLIGCRRALQAELEQQLPLGAGDARHTLQRADHAAFRARVRHTITQAGLERELDREHIAGVHRRFAEQQLTTATLPTAVGGLGRDFSYSVALIEELMVSATASTAVSLMLAAGSVYPLLAREASPAVRDALLPRIAAGRALCAFGITEESGGSDLVGAIRTRARVAGDALVIDGSKMFLTNAPIADHALILARTAEASGPFQASLIIVPLDAAGVSVSAPYDKLGLCGSPTGAITFRDMRVPKHNLVGRLGLGLPLLAEAAAYERTLIAAGSIALATAQVSLALQAVPVESASREALIVHLARLAGQRALITELVARCAGGELDRHDAALLKFAACELAQAAIEAAADAIEQHDAPALIDEVQRALRDCRIFSVFAGASELMRDVYSSSLLPKIRLGAWGQHG